LPQPLDISTPFTLMRFHLFTYQAISQAPCIFQFEMHENTSQRSSPVVVRFSFQMSTSQEVGRVQPEFTDSLLYGLVVASQWFETQFLENGSHCITALDSSFELFVSIAARFHQRQEQSGTRNLARGCHCVCTEGSPNLTEFTARVSHSRAHASPRRLPISPQPHLFFILRRLPFLSKRLLLKNHLGSPTQHNAVVVKIQNAQIHAQRDAVAQMPLPDHRIKTFAERILVEIGKLRAAPLRAHIRYIRARNPRAPRNRVGKGNHKVAKPFVRWIARRRMRILDDDVNRPRERHARIVKRNDAQL